MRTALRRRPVPANRRTQAIPHTFPAPIRGLVTSENLASAGPMTALRLDNFFPTTNGIRCRGGISKKATVASSAPVLSMWTYKSGTVERFFAADETNIFDITSVADADSIPTADITGQTSGYYSTPQISAVGGDFQYAINGDDEAQIYDGTSWSQVDEATHTLAYDAETMPFTVGQTLTGGTSGATATIVEVIDNGTDGVLRINSLSGSFQDNETITDGATGSADADGTEEAVTATITGVDTKDLSFGWVFGSRLFFVEKDTMNVWYLAVDSIGGTASDFSLAGIFQGGGAVWFGATWSLDAGDGLDDKCVFFSTTGQVAVYQGTDPSSGATWSKVGVYQITTPMGPKAVERAGGDVLVATEDGIVPLSQAVAKDSAALSLAAVTRSIPENWANEVIDRRTVNWEMIKWDASNMLIVSQPITVEGQESQCYVANVETGAWCRFTGWDTRCLALYNDRGYFGTSTGEVYEMEVGGTDDGTPYVCVYVGQFDHMKAMGAEKTVMQARATFRAASPFNYKLSVSTNYQISLPSAPASADDYSVAEWDAAVWDTDVWDSSTNETSVSTRWVSIGRTGFVAAPTLQITCGVTPFPRVELVEITMTANIGAMGV